LGGTYINNTDAPKRYAYGIDYVDGTWGYEHAFYEGATYRADASAIAAVPGLVTRLVSTLETGRQNLYLNAVVIKTNTKAITTATYEADALTAVGLGPRVSFARNANHQFDSMMIYSRALSPSEVAQLYYEPYRMLLVPGLPVYYSIPTIVQDGSVVGVTAEAIAEAIAAALSAGSTIQAVTAEVAGDALASGLTAGSTVQGVAAEATTDALVPGLQAGSLITGTAAEVLADGIAPGLAAGSAVVGTAAEVTADGISPSIAAGSALTGVTAGATADANAAILSAGSVLAAVIAEATAEALIPTISTGLIPAPFMLEEPVRVSWLPPPIRWRRPRPSPVP
jgi:hypothetical protein